MGAALALPVLDSMTPAFAGRDAASAGPTRFLVTYIPCGATMAHWTPKETGTDYTFTRILTPLEPFRENISILTGLGHHQAEPNGDGGGQHGRAGAAYLTGVRCKKTGGTDIHAGVSVDQIVARKMESLTRFPSLEMTCDDTRTTGACDSGLSCAYQNTISWRTPTSPLPPLTNPRTVFERLFGNEDLSLAPEERARRNAERKSILDMAGSDIARLAARLGPADRRKIDEYLYSIREVEKRIEASEQPGKTGASASLPQVDKPTGVPVLYSDYLKLMFDLQILTLQTDLTRVITFMYGREASQRTYGEIGIPDPHHPLTHHRGNQDWIEKVTRINVYHAQHFAYFLDKLKSTRDGDASLLDRVMILYGSAISDGNSHSHLNLPVVLAGGGNGHLKHGKHVRYEDAAMTNLFMTLLDTMDIHPESFGDSTGMLDHITTA